MSRIRILPAETANRIAAGEVIERPASVVKELIENAVDAEAGKVVVKIENGGRQLIQVNDDGYGMDTDDAMLALEAHATSKVQDVFDIDRIQTLGFRGEALPSIAGVSRFRLQTRTGNSAAGTEIVVEGGTIRDVRECGCPVGTSVTARNLFYNLPARRKFLRTIATEQNHIQETVLLQAMANPQLGFELVFDGKTALRVPPGGSIETRLQMLLGKSTGRAMLKVDYQEEEISIFGYIGRPGIARSSRREQRIFVNRRPAAAEPVFFAIREAYHTLVMKGRYPPAVIYLELPPQEVDVNVHPTKREIRFRDGRKVEAIVAAAIRKTLRELTGDMVPRKALRPEPDPSTGTFSQAEFIDRSSDNRYRQTPGPDETINDGPDAGETKVAEPGIDPDKSPLIPPDMIAATRQTGPSPSAASRSLFEELQIIGTLKSLYLIAAGDDGLVLIDHHAAHERVLYEKLLKLAGREKKNHQPLLIPVTIDFAPADAALLENNISMFAQLGFQLEPFGGGAFLVNAVPNCLPGDNIEGLMRDLFEELRHTGTTGRERLNEQRIAQAACKHAVRAADKLEDKEISQLLQDLAATEMPYTCPHGRPVMINIPYPEIEKRFGRRS